jgi:hypothetical protein
MRRLHGRQMIETPAHLAGAVVRCQHQAGARPDHAGVRAQLLQPGRVAPVLPGNHRAERRTAVAVPAAHAGALRGQTGGDDAAAGRQFLQAAAIAAQGVDQRLGFVFDVTVCVAQRFNRYRSGGDQLPRPSKTSARLA